MVAAYGRDDRRLTLTPIETMTVAAVEDI